MIFNSLGTISKFNRMGVQAGFGEEGVTLVHRGAIANEDPDASEPNMFEYVVSQGSTEVWGDGMSVFHNPGALHPLSHEVLPHAAHHRILPNGQIETTALKPPVISSTTSVLIGV